MLGSLLSQQNCATEDNPFICIFCYVLKWWFNLLIPLAEIPAEWFNSSIRHPGGFRCSGGESMYVQSVK